MIPLESPIATGRTAEIYPWPEGLVLKLFYDWVSKGAVQTEADVARAVYAAGLPVPAVGELVQVRGRRGLLYERVDGATMLDELSDRPWTLLQSARRLAELHAIMHSLKPAAELPSQCERLAAKIRDVRELSPEQRNVLLDALAKMPADNRLCHGDLHPANVIVAQRGPVIIDWIDATLGNPLADVARTSVLVLGEAHNESHPWVWKRLINWYHRVYLRTYFGLRPGGEAEYEAWRPIVAAARMSEGIDEVQSWLLEQAAVLFW